MSFTADISRFADKAKLSHDEAVVGVCTKLTGMVIDKTPFDKGRLRGNWYAEIDIFSSETSETRSESEALADGKAKAQKASGKLFTLTNNLPYAHRIEYLSWSKIKAPTGMARISIAEITNALKRG